MSWELCQTIKNIGMMIYRVSKTSRECCICTGCPGKLQKGNNFHHFRVQKAVHIQGMSRDGLLLSVWDRTFTGDFLWLWSVDQASKMSPTVPSAALCTKCASPPAVTVAGVSAQPGCDTSFGSILVLHSVALAVAASVENLKITVRKWVWRVFNLETLSPPRLTFALACSR